MSERMKKVDLRIFDALPDTVNIEGIPYCIEYPDRIGRGDKWGECDMDRKTIKVQAGATSMMVEQTLIHEMLHAIAHEFGFGLSEKKVRRLEKSLYRVFCDNGWVIRTRGDDG